MARTKELLGLIAGFAAGTFLGALFVATDNPKSDKEKDKDKDKENKKEKEAKVVIEKK